MLNPFLNPAKTLDLSGITWQWIPPANCVLCEIVFLFMIFFLFETFQFSLKVSSFFNYKNGQFEVSTLSSLYRSLFSISLSCLPLLVSSPNSPHPFNFGSLARVFFFSRSILTLLYLWTTSISDISFLRYDDQNWAQHSRWGHAIDFYNAFIIFSVLGRLI